MTQIIKTVDSAFTAGVAPSSNVVTAKGETLALDLTKAVLGVILFAGWNGSALAADADTGRATGITRLSLSMADLLALAATELDEAESRHP